MNSEIFYEETGWYLYSDKEHLKDLSRKLLTHYNSNVSQYNIDYSKNVNDTPFTVYDDTFELFYFLTNREMTMSESVFDFVEEVIIPQLRRIVEEYNSLNSNN